MQPEQTKPRTIFPKDIPSSVSEAECEKLAELSEGKRVLELGAWRGRTTVVLAQVARRLVSIDWHHGDPHAGGGVTIGPYFSNLIRYGQLGPANSQHTYIVGRFEDILPLFRPHSFDMIFHDGYHSYANVKRDIELILELATSDTVLCFHDYGVETEGEGDAFGVTQAVDEFFEVDETVESLAVVREIEA
jgi:predicted O-methyltransferase YrrM